METIILKLLLGSMIAVIAMIPLQLIMDWKKRDIIDKIFTVIFIIIIMVMILLLFYI